MSSALNIKEVTRATGIYVYHYLSYMVSYHQALGRPYIPSEMVALLSASACDHANAEHMRLRRSDTTN